MDLYIGRKRLCACMNVNPFIGLMFQTPHPVVFSFKTPRIIALHNMFVLGNTDVLFVHKNKVVEIARTFRPFTFYTPSKKATHVIELPAGTSAGVSVGDRITLR